MMLMQAMLKSKLTPLIDVRFQTYITPIIKAIYWLKTMVSEWIKKQFLNHGLSYRILIREQ